MLLIIKKTVPFYSLLIKQNTKAKMFLLWYNKLFLTCNLHRIFRTVDCSKIRGFRYFTSTNLPFQRPLAPYHIQLVRHHLQL